MVDYLGKKVEVSLNASGKKRLGCDNDKLIGEILKKVDWLVGCPVLSCDLGILGVGYDCDIIKVFDKTNPSK